MEGIQVQSPPVHKIRAPRPVGISLLIALEILGLLAILLILPFLISRADITLEKISEAFSMLGYSASVVLMGFIFLTLVSVFCLAGMIMGVPWGWHLCCFLYLYRIGLNLSALIQLPGLFADLQERFDSSGRGIGFYVFKFAVRIAIAAALYMYFFKPNVRAYFRIDWRKTGQYVLCHAGSVVLMFILFYVLSLLMPA